MKVSARGVVHLCEVTLNARIDSSNVYDAFQVQHPDLCRHPLSYLYPPRVPGAGGGDIMEEFCAEVLENHGIPHMEYDQIEERPVWQSRSYVSLNRKPMHELKLYGDLLIPSAPHNLLISVKSEAARERFVVSGNRLDSVGFGFFNDPSEFWTENRMNMLKRWGFIAIYMPDATLDAINAELIKRGTKQVAININGKALYRPITEFGSDMVRVAGRLTYEL